MAEVQKRWMKCLVWQQVLTTVIWTASNALLGSTLHAEGLTLSSFGIGILRFCVFQMSMALLLLGNYIVTSPEEKAAAGLLELAVGFMGAVIGAGWGRWEGALRLRQRAQTTADWVLFVFITSFVGLLALLTVTPGLMNPFDAAIRGAALGFIYGLHYIYKRLWVLSFPIIQVYCSLPCFQVPFFEE